ncbi:hypothetical protein [Streptomyces triticisoli]|uniref:hypothetical protein n=1 Tax=Streptomyces triticisoli TaxID=2182797 RepID=UPI0013001830|nr:hypothetical protein [Streptomyces triticisoli]
MMLFVMAGCGRHEAGAGADTAGDPITKGLVADLRKSGFRVNPGYPMLYTQQDCENYTYPLLKNCSLNNPAAPYVVPAVKTWPDEYVDPATANASGETRPGYTTTYRLDPRDAVVIYGKMPPPGRYMGMQTWEFSQNGQWKDSDRLKWENTADRPVPMQYLFDTIPPDGRRSGRTQSVSALGDVVNNVVMERQSGYSFEKNRYFIITASATTDRAVRRALQARGVPGKDIFTEQIPARDDHGPIGPLGMGKDAIDFFTAFRYAVPDPGQEQAADKWRKNPPLTVMRVRAPDSLGPVQRYGPLTFAKRTANNEAHLAGDLQNLVSAVCDRVSSTARLRTSDCTQQPPASSLMVDPVRDYGWTGPYCREINMNCLGDQQDAAYFLARPLPLDSGQVYAVVDTLATETGNATYTALSVNDASLLEGVANVLNTTLKGSADGYASTVKNSGKFFVHYFTRDCAVLRDLPGWPKNCTGITTRMLPSHSDTSAKGDPALHGMFMASLRDYVKPGTERGPDSTKLLTPRILTFTQPGK